MAGKTYNGKYYEYDPDTGDYVADDGQVLPNITATNPMDTDPATKQGQNTADPAASNTPDVADPTDTGAGAKPVNPMDTDPATKQGQDPSNAGGPATTPPGFELSKTMKEWWDSLDEKTKTKIKGAGGGIGLLLLDKLLGGGLMESKRQATGYQGAIDMGMRADRRALQGTNDPNRMPGSGGISYLTPVALSTTDPASQAAATNYLNTTQQQGNAANAAVNATLPKFATGGIAALKPPQYLRGSTDGMADEIPATIDDNQPARLAHGEFVVPADVVSHLGNGNSDAGAQKLHEMMDNVRQARTGTKEQGKEIDPDQFISTASGGIANLARPATPAAPQELRFDAGGTVPQDSPLNTYFGPYVNTMMSQANALAEAPYQRYQGPLTAGTSALQDQAYLGASSLQLPQNMGTTGYTPTSFTQQGVSQQYMNPYIQNALNPTIAEMRRQSDITQMQNNAKMVGAGAYGGSRQALMNTETQRNLLDKIGQTVGQGYATAFDKAQGQFNTEQDQQRQAQQDINKYGIDVLNMRSNLGNQQRDIMQQGIAADKAAFEEERANPYKMLQFKQAMLSGMPVTNTQAGQYAPSLLTQLASAGLGGLTLAQILGGTGG